MKQSRSRLPRSFSLLAIVILVIAVSCRAFAESNGPILVLYAFGEEGRVLISKMTADSAVHVLGRDVHLGTLSGKNVVLAESGVGMTNAAMTTEELISRFHPRALVFSGIAGAIDSSVHIGDLCVSSAWIAHDMLYAGPDSVQPMPIRAYSARNDSIESFWAFPADTGLVARAAGIKAASLNLQNVGARAPRILVGGTGVSGNSFIDNAEKRLWLNKRFGALVTDMESASVAQVCTVNGVPFVIIRSASDLAGGAKDATAEAQLDQFFKIAAANSAGLVMELIGLVN